MTTVDQGLPVTGMDITGSFEIQEIDHELYERVQEEIAKMLRAHQIRVEESVSEAVHWLLVEAPGELPAGELRMQIVKRWGAEVDSELARMFVREE